MKKTKIAIILISVIFFILLARWGFISSIDNSDQKEYIYFVSKSVSENRRFWSMLEDGAKTAASRNGKKLIILGPQKETEIDVQIEIMQDIIKEKPYGIIIAAIDYEQLANICDEAMDKGVSLVAVDSDVNTIKEHSIVATDNSKATSDLAQLIMKKTPACSYAIVSHVKGVKTTSDRANTFKKELDQAGIYTFVGEYYSNNRLSGAVDATNDILEKNPDVGIIFGTNEITLEGIADVISEKKLQDDILVVGFDTNEKIVRYLEDDVVDYTMAQQPFNMGYIAVEQLINTKKGKIENIDTKAVIIDKNNAFEELNTRLVFPIDIKNE